MRLICFKVIKPLDMRVNHKSLSKTLNKTMKKTNPSPKDSFTSNIMNKKMQTKNNKEITATLARREYLLRELKETNSILHHLMSQLNLDEEYKKLYKAY